MGIFSNLIKRLPRFGKGSRQAVEEFPPDEPRMQKQDNPRHGDSGSILRKLFPKREVNEERPQAGVRFGISWPLLFALCLILVCAVGWAFFMGLMVGRGQNPQTSLQSMAGIKQEEQAEAPAIPVLPDPPSPEPAPANEATAEDSAVAAPEKAPVAAPTKPATPRAAQPKPSPDQRFDYTFQVAALKSNKDAKAVNSTLTKNGFRSSVSKSGRVWLVIISLRGGPGDVNAMQKKLRSLKMGRAMQLSKKPLGQKKRKSQ